MELLLMFLKILVILLLAEGVVYGVTMIILLKLINISHKEDEERMQHEGD